MFRFGVRMKSIKENQYYLKIRVHKLWRRNKKIVA